jgi:glycosyltransferase involved in cell wall biosynthesis
MKNVKLSLVLPCYNEAEHFRKSSLAILKTLRSCGFSYEVIFIDDKSKDNTAGLIKKLVEKEDSPNIEAYYHKFNVGRGGTVMHGIKVARGKYVGFIDIDCEVSPRYIPICISVLEKRTDVICGERIYEVNVSGFTRAVASKLYSLLVAWLLKPPIVDTESGYKFFNRQKIKSILEQVRDRGWFWDTEIIIRSHLAGLRVKSLPVQFRRRSDKTSTVNLLRATCDYLVKLVMFQQQLTHERNPNK